MRLQAAVLSNAGRVREKNEDNYYYNGEFMPATNRGVDAHQEWVQLDRPALFGVFDGMGGYAAGERASNLTAQAADRLWREWDRTGTPADLMERICMEANSVVCDAMEADNGRRMGSTASMLMFDNEQYHVCNIGDSPIFLLRQGQLWEISMEHTERWTFEKVTGQKAPPKKKFRLTQNIGIFEDEMAIEPYCGDGPIQKGDVFLICSDGVTDMLDREEVQEILSKPLPTGEMIRQLLAGALEAGGKDNITAICLRVCLDPMPEEPAAPQAAPRKAPAKAGKKPGKRKWGLIFGGVGLAVAVAAGAVTLGLTRGGKNKGIKVKEIVSGSLFCPMETGDIGTIDFDLN